MKKDHIIYLAILVYTILQIFLIEILSSSVLAILLIFLPIVVSFVSVKSLSFKFNENKQKAYIIIFLCMILPLNYFLSSFENNLNFTHNFQYFMKLVLIPSGIYIVISYLIYKLSFKLKFQRYSGVSLLVIIYSLVGSLMVLSSLILGSLLNHSV
jgi:hypothetical protein